MRTQTSRIILAVAAVAALGAGTVAIGIHRHGWGVWHATAGSTMEVHPTAPISASPSISNKARAVSAVVQAVNHAIKNAVVHISARIELSPPNLAANLPARFRRMLPPGIKMGEAQSPEVKIHLTGTGLIISPKGYLVTNNHLVAGAKSVKVTLANGQTYTGTVIGTDPQTDLAVVQITAPHLTYARLGNSHHLKVGERVLAFGALCGAKQTITPGIISAKSRQGVEIISLHQPPNAVINPGNSGGPLVTMQGQVIGINRAIASNPGASNGVAIPSNQVKYIAWQLIKHGKVVRGYLGVNISDIRHRQIRHVAKTLGYKGHHGILVEHVAPSTPAAHAGLRLADIIIAFDGRKIRRISQLLNEIAMTHPGTKITLRIFRNDKKLNLTFPVGAQPATLAHVGTGGGGGHGQGPLPIAPGLGIAVAPVTAAVAKADHMAVPHGVLIQAVNPASAAAMVGIRPGDVILSVQGQPVNSPAEFQNALHRANTAKGIKFSLRSPHGVKRFAFVQEGK